MLQADNVLLGDTGSKRITDFYHEKDTPKECLFLKFSLAYKNPAVEEIPRKKEVLHNCDRAVICCSGVGVHLFQQVALVLVCGSF